MTGFQPKLKKIIFHSSLIRHLKSFDIAHDCSFVIWCPFDPMGFSFPRFVIVRQIGAVFYDVVSKDGRVLSPESMEETKNEEL